jgi:transcriptional regulator with XRE-family HTH domain
MDDVRIGLLVRAVRHRLGWRQQDVAARACVSQDTVSRIERGQLDALQLRTIRSVLRALEVYLAQEVRWRGGDLDRLADASHAALVSRVCALLESAGWIVRPEVSFAIYGERGSVDVVAWHPEGRILLVVEVKTTLNSVEETLRRHDVKVRLAPRVVADRFGWVPATVGRLLVLPDLSTARRRVASHDHVLRAAYPSRGRDAVAWLRDPSSSRSMMVFLSPALPRRGSASPVSRRRVRAPGAGTIATADALATGPIPTIDAPGAPATDGLRRPRPSTPGERG